ADGRGRHPHAGHPRADRRATHPVPPPGTPSGRPPPCPPRDRDRRHGGRRHHPPGHLRVRLPGRHRRERPLPRHHPAHRPPPPLPGAPQRPGRPLRVRALPPRKRLSPLGDASMSRRITKLSALAALTLLCSLLPGGGAWGARSQEQPVEIGFRRSEPSSGKLKVTVAMSGTQWGREQRLDSGDFTATINGRPVEVTGATPLQEQKGSRGQLAVMLAVDTSGSMLEAPNGVPNIDRAKAAAIAFVQRMPRGDRIGLIAFSTTPAVVQALTADHELVRTRIGSLTAQGDTALYDAVVLASRQLAGERGQHNLVGLSDGRDDGSKARLEGAIAAATRAGVTVYTVGLNGPGRSRQDQAALRKLAEGTQGGKAFEVGNADQLVNQFSDIAQTLASQYVVDMKLPPGLGSEVDFQLKAGVGSEAGVVTTPRV